LGPPQHGRKCAKVQDPGRRRPRRRLCLLKGCEKPFQPSHPQARYCSEACRQAARRWRAWRARQRYRATDQGKACRRSQSRRYRERARASQRSAASQSRTRRRGAADLTVSEGREGQRPAHVCKKSLCDRPGCYTCFDPHPRSPLQRFCSSLCRCALQRVLEREARWRRRCLRRRIERRSG